MRCSWRSTADAATPGTSASHQTKVVASRSRLSGSRSGALSLAVLGIALLVMGVLLTKYDRVLAAKYRPRRWPCSLPCC